MKETEKELLLNKIYNLLGEAYSLSERHEDLSDIGSAISRAEDIVDDLATILIVRKIYNVEHSRRSI